MKKNNLKKFLLWILKIGLVLCLAMPFILSSTTYFPFVVGKAVFFQILVEILFIIYLILAYLNPKYRPKRSLITWSVLAYFIIVTLASLFGIDSYFSFWTNYERMDGLFNLYHFGVYFLILSAVFKKREDWLTFFRILLVSLVMIDIIGFLQKMGLSSLSQFAGERAFSTLGNATYLGTLAVFQGFIALFLFLADRNIFWRVFYGINAFLAIVAVMISQTRGALLGGYLGLIIFLLLTSLFLENKKKRLLSLGLLSSLILLSGIIILGLSFPNSWLGEKIPDRFNVLESGLRYGARPHSWQITATAWKEKPLLGWGRSSNAFVFPKFYNPEIAEKSEVWFDKPHNKILEVGVDSGILGVLSYLTIFGGAIYILWKKRHAYAEISFALIALVVVYFIQNLFLFDHQSSYLWWFSVLGFINFLSLEDEKKNHKQASSQNSVFLSIALILIAITGFAFFKGSIMPFMAAKKGIQALTLEYQGGSAEKVNQMYREALDMNTFGRQEILTQASKPFMGIYKQGGKEKLLPYLEFIREEEEKFYAEKPHDIKNYLTLANLYQISSNFDKKYIDKAQEIYLNFYKEAPQKFEALYNLAHLAFREGDFKTMDKYLHKAFELNPDYYKNYWEAAEIFFLGGDYGQARLLFGNAINKGAKWQQVLGSSFLRKEDNEWFIEVFKRLRKIEPDSPDPHLYLAAFYGNISNNEKFFEHLRKAVEIKPEIENNLEKDLNIDL